MYVYITRLTPSITFLPIAPAAAWSKAVARQDGYFGALALGSKSGHITLWRYV
jgi:hypothetical protein